MCTYVGDQIPYTRKFSRYEFFAEQEANRVFADYRFIVER